MPRARRFKFDVGDWIAHKGVSGWELAGKVVSADSDLCRVETRTGEQRTYVPGDDPIARVRWIGRGRWEVAS